MGDTSRAEPREVYRKVAVLGCRDVGKSALTIQYTENRFDDAYLPTIENTYQCSIKMKRVVFNADIVDTAGMDDYCQLSRAASVGVHGYLLLYAINNRESFLKLQTINQRLIDVMGAGNELHRVLVGTKTDSNKREVSFEEGRSLANEWDCPFIECSSKNNHCVSDVFIAMMKEIESETGLLESRPDKSCICF